MTPTPPRTADVLPLLLLEMAMRSMTWSDDCGLLSMTTGELYYSMCVTGIFPAGAPEKVFRTFHIGLLSPIPPGRGRVCNTRIERSYGVRLGGPAKCQISKQRVAPQLRRYRIYSTSGGRLIGASARVLGGLLKVEETCTFSITWSWRHIK